MNKLALASIAAACALACTTSAFAQNMSKAEYKSARDGIAADYKAASKACASMSGNAKDICAADATGKQKVARAELEARNIPGAKNDYALSIARAKADYALAKEKCDDIAGAAKKACVKDAKTARAGAETKAQMQMANVAGKPAQAAANVSMSGKEAANESVVDRATAAKVKAPLVAIANAPPVTEPSPKLAQAKVESGNGNGKAVYEKSCKGCHAAMKPKTGDKEAWAPLARQGAAALTASVIKGKGVMPPKGTAASDADVKVAVEYMLSQSK
jgi:cytochrome c5